MCSSDLLRGARTVLDLPADRPRPALQTTRGGRASLDIPAALTDSLKALSRREGTTLFMTLMAAFNVMLRHYSGQDDILVGTNSAGRDRTETEGLIGFFVNMLAIRTRLASGATFRELLGQVRSTTLGAYAHQDLPFETLVEELKPERELSRTPLFQVVFTLQNAPSEALSLPGLKLSSLPVEKETAKYDLVLNMFETKQGLACSLAYNSDIFEASSVGRMLDAYATLLGRVAIEPDATLDALDAALSEARRRQQDASESEFAETRRRLLKNVRRRASGEPHTEA